MKILYHLVEITLFLCAEITSSTLFVTDTKVGLRVAQANVFHDGGQQNEYDTQKGVTERRKHRRRRTEYSRDFYPDYCSDPWAMKNRKIPPLPENFTSTAAGNTNESSTTGGSTTFQSQILQVIAIFRHGARTPYTPLSCWTDYTLDWDCSLTTLMAPTRHPDNDESNRTMFLFERRYTALKAPQSNYLNGTCHLGQLLEEGYDQMYTNGQYIRETYITNEKQPQLKLFDSVYYAQRPYDEAIYLRSDDEQRTLVSGQVMLEGIFELDSTSSGQETIIPIHTADWEQDILDPNENICPALQKIKTAALKSAAYVERVQSKDTKRLMSIMTDDIGASAYMTENGNFIDCLMTSYCTDRPMPEILLRDFKSENDGSLFNKFLDFVSSDGVIIYELREGR